MIHLSNERILGRKSIVLRMMKVTHWLSRLLMVLNPLVAQQIKKIIARGSFTFVSTTTLVASINLNVKVKSNNKVVSK